LSSPAKQHLTFAGYFLGWPAGAPLAGCPAGAPAAPPAGGVFDVPLEAHAAQKAPATNIMASFRITPPWIQVNEKVEVS